MLKDKGDESLPLLAFRRYVVKLIFLKYSKKGKLSSSRLEIRNIPSDVCYDDTKHYQVQFGEGRYKVNKKNFRCRYVICKSA